VQLLYALVFDIFIKEILYYLMSEFRISQNQDHFKIISGNKPRDISGIEPWQVIKLCSSSELCYLFNEE